MKYGCVISDAIVPWADCKRLDAYVTVPGVSLFKVAADGCTLEVV